MNVAQTKDDGVPCTCSIGSYLATRLEQIGLKHHFAVAGDYNLVLLDQLLLNKNIQQVYCCNELNCAFAAEGYGDCVKTNFDFRKVISLC